MECSTTTARFVPESVWIALTGTTVRPTATVVLAVSASLFAISVGDPDAVMLAALIAASAVLLGLALARAFEHARVHGVPIVDRPLGATGTR